MHLTLSSLARLRHRFALSCCALLATFVASPQAEAANSAAKTPKGAIEVDSRVPGHKPAAVAVVVLSNAAGRPFDTAVERHLLRELTGHLHAVPTAEVRAGVLALHGTASTLHLPATLLSLGRRLHVPYVMVVEAVGRPKPSHVFVGLVDVAKGKTMLTHREAVRGGTLDATSGHAFAEEIAKIFGGRAHVAQQKEELHRAPERQSEPARPKHAAVQESQDDSEEAAAKAGHRRGHVAAAGGHKDKAPSEEGMAHALLPTLRIGTGLQLMQRVARIKPPSVDGVAAPCYCSSGKSAQPLFPAVVLSGEVTSGIFLKDRRAWPSSFGLRVDFVLAPVKTVVFKQDGSKSSIKSLAYVLDASFFYRFAWFGGRRLTPDVKIGVGIHKFAFPLKGSQFTGVDYLAPDIQLAVDVPIIAQLGAFAAFDLRPALKAGKDAAAVLGKEGKGLGFGGQVGLRGGTGLLAFDLSFHIDRYQVPFSGTTNFANMPAGANGTPVQFTNVKLTDQVLGVMAHGSLAF